MGAFKGCLWQYLMRVEIFVIRSGTDQPLLLLRINRVAGMDAFHVIRNLRNLLWKHCFLAMFPEVCILFTQQYTQLGKKSISEFVTKHFLFLQKQILFPQQYLQGWANSELYDWVSSRRPVLWSYVADVHKNILYSIYIERTAFPPLHDTSDNLLTSVWNYCQCWHDIYICSGALKVIKNHRVRKSSMIRCWIIFICALIHFIIYVFYFN